MRAIIAVFVSWNKGWLLIWIECDSALWLACWRQRQSIFAAVSIYKWLYVLDLLGRMEFYISNLYLEGNQVAQNLANCGVHLFFFFFFPITLVNCDTMASYCYCFHWDCVFTYFWNALNCCTSFRDDFKVCIYFCC